MTKRNETPHLECHATVHDWDETAVATQPGYSGFGVAFDYRCTRCHGIKRVIVSRNTGLVLSRFYMMPDSYKTHGTPKSDFRKEWINKKLRKNLRVVS